MNTPTHARIIHFLKKITLLDWIVCIILIASFSYFLLNRYSKTEEWVHIKLKVTSEEWWWTVNPPEYWYAQGLKNGAFAYNSFGKKIAEIQSIENYDAGASKRIINANIALLVTRNNTTQATQFGYQQLQVGKPLELTFDQYNIRGLVTHIGNSSTLYEDTVVDIKILAAQPWEASSFVKELESKDSEGHVVATIEDVSYADAQIYEFLDKKGRLVLLPAFNQSRKDITMKVRLKTFTAEGVRLFVDGTAIKIGESIKIQFPQTAIRDGVISKIY